MKNLIIPIIALLGLASCNKEPELANRHTFDGETYLVLSVSWNGGVHTAPMWLNPHNGSISTFNTNYEPLEAFGSGDFWNNSFTLHIEAPYNGSETTVDFYQSDGDCRVFASKGDQYSDYRSNWEILFPCHPRYSDYD